MTLFPNYLKYIQYPLTHAQGNVIKNKIHLLRSLIILIDNLKIVKGELCHPCYKYNLRDLIFIIID